MSVVERDAAISEFGSFGMIEELWQRGDLGLAAREFKRRTRQKPWQRLRLGRRVWGLSGRWLAVCPWNGDEAWITLPFIYFGAGTKHVELGLGQGKWHVSIDIRWRYD